MRKIIQLMIAGLMIVSLNLNAQQDAKSFVKQYKKQDGFTVVSIGKPAMKLMSLFAKASDNEASQVISRVDAIQVLVCDSWNKTRNESFNNEALTFCDANRYDELIEVIEQNETVKIFCKTEGESITGLIILTHSNHHDIAMVCLSGRFTANDLQTITKSNGKHIAGLN